jgi:beta-lactamase regulating signal transducer with metallopeptidase domain
VIAAWMLYIVAISCLLALAASALEYGLNALSRPTRWVWAVALSTALCIPAISVLRPAVDQPVPPAAIPVGDWTVSGLQLETPFMAKVVAVLDVVNAPLVAIWVLTSLAVVTALGISGWRMKRQSLRWVPGRVDGVPVRYSASSGPAVIGCFPGVIVLPRWTRALEHEWQAMMVAHEEEHLRAQDTGLIAWGLLAVALLPWNPLVWWKFRRLKHAVELDCDRRVLRRGVDPNAYGNLLVELTERARRGPLPAAAFSAPKPLLTRRIRLMMRPTLPRYRLHALAAISTAAVITAIGCELPTPPEPDTVARHELADNDPTLAEQPHVKRLRLLSEAYRVLADSLAPPRIIRATDLARLVHETGRLALNSDTGLEAIDAAETSLRALRVREIAKGSVGESTIRLNGPRSGVDGSRPAPWVFVDGIRLGQAELESQIREDGLTRLAEIDPDAIERIEVLKGVAVHRIYGAQAGGGVIRVTTKEAARRANN